MNRKYLPSLSYCFLTCFLAPVFGTAGFINPPVGVSGSYTQNCLANGVVCSTGGDSGITDFPSAPSVSIATPDYSVSQTATADTSLSATLSPGDLHAYAEAGATIPVQNLPNPLAQASSTLDIQTQDYLNFFSSTLAAGTTIDFELSGLLHSTFTDSTPGNCGQGLPSSQAQLSAVGSGNIGNIFAPGTFVHDSCGNGTDLMTSSVVLQSTVGGSIGLLTTFEISASAGLGFPELGTVTSVTDASDTAAFYVDVLTPGVTFASASGFSYEAQASPEPATGLLLVLALLGCMLARGARIAATSK